MKNYIKNCLCAFLLSLLLPGLMGTASVYADPGSDVKFAAYVSSPISLSMTKSGEGSGNIVASTGKIIWNGDSGAGTYKANARIKLTAKPAVDSSFAGWGGACSGTTTTCLLTMDSAKDVTAGFDLLPRYSLEVTKSGEGSGTVTGSLKGLTKGISCGANCSETYLMKNSGKPLKVTLKAKAAAGSAFTGWTGACSGTGTCMVTMNEDNSAIALFSLSGRPMSLSKKSADPGEVLEITSSGLNPNAQTYVIFKDKSGYEIKVLSASVTTKKIKVRVPVFIDTTSYEIGPGTVSITVTQEADSVKKLFGPATNFQIGDLPKTVFEAGTITLEVIKQIQDSLDSASQSWEIVGSASSGNVPTFSMKSELGALSAQLKTIQAQVQQLIDGETDSIDLGSISDRPVYIDSSSLAVLDRLFAAYLMSGQTTSASALTKLSKAAGSTSCTTTSCLRDQLQESLTPNVGESTKTIFSTFDKLQEVLAAAIPITAAGAVAFGALPAAAAISVAGTAGAVLFFTTTVAPGVIGLSALSFAEPFIELELGRPITIEDYQSGFDHVRKGSVDFLQGELEGKILDGALTPAVADAALRDRFVFVLSSAKTILGLQDPSDSGSMTSKAFNNSQSIFTNMPHSYYNLTYSTSGVGSGSVGLSSGGINCGPNCARYISDLSVTLTATAGSGSSFTGWGGACSGKGTCTVTMDSAKSVTASFNDTPETMYSLTITPGGNGTGTITSSPSGIECGSVCLAYFPKDSSVTLTATNNEGSAFGGWSGECSGTGDCTVVMNGNKAITATIDIAAPVDNNCCACIFDVYSNAFGPGGAWICHNVTLMNDGYCPNVSGGYLVSPGTCVCDPGLYQVCN